MWITNLCDIRTGVSLMLHCQSQMSCFLHTSRRSLTTQQQKSIAMSKKKRKHKAEKERTDDKDDIGSRPDCESLLVDGGEGGSKKRENKRTEENLDDQQSAASLPAPSSKKLKSKRPRKDAELSQDSGAQIADKRRKKKSRGSKNKQRGMSNSVLRTIDDTCARFEADGNEYNTFLLGQNLCARRKKKTKDYAKGVTFNHHERTGVTSKGLFTGTFSIVRSTNHHFSDQLVLLPQKTLTQVLLMIPLLLLLMTVQ
jgi:hypothetical protein